MTPQAQRIAIAEAVGWRRETKQGRAPGYELTYWTGPDGRDYGIHPLLPDYLTDLNAITAAARSCAERVMNADQWEDFGRFLVQAHPTAVIQDANGMIDFHDLATLMTGLTAAQYAECLLKALGKWTE